MATRSIAINSAAKAVLPNGSKLGRAEILTQLGLNPTTPPDAWLAIVACGSNASALDVRDAAKLIDRSVVTRRSFDAATLAKIDKLRTR